MSGVFHGLGLGLGLLHTVELLFWCLQGLGLSLGGCYKYYSPRTYAHDDTLLMVWLSGVSHGLGLGLGLSQSYCFGVCRVLVCHWDDVTSFIAPGCTVMVILYL